MADENKMEEMKGRAKQAGGDLTDNDEMKREGKADETSANVKDKVNDAVDSVKNTFK